jgi:hypothetical protein
MYSSETLYPQYGHLVHMYKFLYKRMYNYPSPRPQMLVGVRRGMGVNGYAAVDDIVFFQFDNCLTQPDWADPTHTTATQPATVTTEIPPSKWPKVFIYNKKLCTRADLDDDISTFL